MAILENNPYSKRLCELAREAYDAGEIEHAVIALRSLIGQGFTPDQAMQVGKHLCFLRGEFLSGRLNDGERR